MSQNQNKSAEADRTADLLYRVSHHDKSAFQELFTLIAPRLKNYAIQQGSTQRDAEEIVQETMLTIWRKAHLFDRSKASANTWLFTIVRNKRIDFYRKDRPDLIVSDDLWPNEERNVESAETQEELAEKDLNAKNLRNMIGELPVEQRQVLYKMYFEGKSHGEIADEMDLPLGTVKSRIRLAMGKLEASFKGQQTWLVLILLMNSF